MRRVIYALAVVAACGGKAVIDDPLGAGGAGAGNAVDDDGSPLCFTPDPVGDTFVCDESSSAGSGAPLECVTTLCDEDANLWTSKCVGDACECIFNFEQRCICSINEPGNTFCQGLPSCCPSPFPP
jgi:hypothetical protein